MKSNVWEKMGDRLLGLFIGVVLTLMWAHL